MDRTAATEIMRLDAGDALELAPLLAAYGQALKRGAPRRPDQVYAEGLLQDRSAEVLGARIDGRLVGFLIVYDLPEPVSGARFGQVDHIFMLDDHRNLGIARAMIDVLAEESEERGWSKLVLNAPRRPADGRRLYEKIAVKSDASSWIVRFRP